MAWKKGSVHIGCVYRSGFQNFHGILLKKMCYKNSTKIRILQSKASLFHIETIQKKSLTINYEKKEVII